MRELGEYLRLAREERGVTLEEIQAGTKIRLRYLEAMEQGDFEVIPGQVYVRGFLHNYAVFAGLDPRAILARYDEELRASTRQASLSEQPDAAAEPPSPAPLKRVRLTWWQPSLIAGAIILAALGIFLLKNMANHPPDEPSPAEAPVTVVNPLQEEGVRLVLRYSARCWVRIFCDGRGAFEATVNPGTIQEWRAEQVITATFGNAGAVGGELNGKPLPSLGATGITVTKEFRAGQL